MVSFKRPPRDQKTRGGLGTFDFLGMTHYWSRSQRGNWVVKRKTSANKLRRTLKAHWQWCRFNRHMAVHEQHAALSLKLRGHYGYFGLRGNDEMLGVVYRALVRAWRYWLGRRTRQGYIPMAAFDRFLARYPLPKPRTLHPF